MFSLYKICKPLHIQKTPFKVPLHKIQKRAFFANPIPPNNDDNMIWVIFVCVCYITYRNITKEPPTPPPNPFL